jgi:hypothetical protein
MLSFVFMRGWLLAAVVISAAPGCHRSAAPAAVVAQPATREPRNAAECRACNGEWGPHGLLQAESCLCRTHDSGKSCRDGLECEGECVVQDVKTEVVEPGPPRRGFFIGQCSEFDHVFGCNKLLMDGTAAKPTSLEEPPGEVCVD